MKVVALCLCIAFGIILLIHLVPLSIWGEMRIYEDIQAVAIAETVMAIGILVFGVWGLCKR